MDRITFILIAGLVWIVTIILVIVVLTLINNKENVFLVLHYWQDYDNLNKL